MASYTTYKNLEKPDAAELYNINVANKNNDIIDSELHKLELKSQNQDELRNHISDKSNPHNVTKKQIGLDRADNTSDMDKPVSAAQQSALDAALSNHNTSESSHSDMRLLISGLTARLNALADSDDTTLDQLSEIVAYIKNNKSLIEGVTTNKINVSDIVDDLTTSSADKPLSANQGKILQGLITDLTAAAENKVDKIPGKGLSANDYTAEEKAKLAGITAGANVNIQSDWNEADTASDAFIKNKPAIPTNQEFLEFIRENGLFDLDGKGRPLLPGYGIVTADNVVINYTNGTGYTDKTIEELFGITDNSSILYIFGFDTEKAGSQSPSCAIDSNNKIRAAYGATNYKGAIYTFACIYKLPVPYEPGLRSITKEFTINNPNGEKMVIAGNVSDFGVNVTNVVASFYYCVNEKLASILDITNEGVIRFVSNYNIAFSDIVVAITLLVKDYSSIGSAIVTDGIRMVTKDVTFTTKGSSITTILTAEDLDFDFDTIISVDYKSKTVDGYTGYAVLNTVNKRIELITGANTGNGSTLEGTIYMFVKVPVVETRKPFVKDVNLTLDGTEFVFTGITLDGSDEVGGYTIDNFSSITAIPLYTIKTLIHPPVIVKATKEVYIVGVDNTQAGTTAFRICIS